jgi:hypothetical protein
VDDVVDLDGCVVGALVGLFGGRIGTGIWFGNLVSIDKSTLLDEVRVGKSRTDIDGALCDHMAVNLVDDAIDFFEIVGIRDDFIAGDDVLVDDHVDDWKRDDRARKMCDG